MNIPLPDHLIALCEHINSEVEVWFEETTDEIEIELTDESFELEKNFLMKKL